MDENGIEFEFPTDRKYYGVLRQSYLALKLKLVKGRSYDTYTVKEGRKERKVKELITANAYGDSTDDENTESTPFVSYVDNIVHWFFSRIEVYNITN